MRAAKRLTARERQALTRCERVIRRSIDHQVAIADALAEIRDSQLYREKWRDFNAYTTERWGFTGRHARRIIAIADILREIPEATYRQACALQKVEPERRREVLSQAQAMGGRMSARQIRRAAGELDELVSAAFVLFSQFANAMLDVLGHPDADAQLSRRDVAVSVDQLRKQLTTARQKLKHAKGAA